MRNFIDRLHKLSVDTYFRCRQNKLAEVAYEVLTAAYCPSTPPREKREENIVKNICNAFSDQKQFYQDVTIYAEKIHGSKSFVKFRNDLSEAKKDHSLVTKEMADMVVIAIATENDKILFEKIAFIQNKKEVTSNSVTWVIDQDQLFLLQNFPNFHGKSGLFYNKNDKDKNYTLHNTYGKLGNYGLFLSPGEMIFANAKLSLSTRICG